MLSFLSCFPEVETLHVMMISSSGGGGLDNSDGSDDENEEGLDSSDNENEGSLDTSDDENEDENHDDNPSKAEASGELDFRFWQEVDPIECVEGHVKKVVLDQFSAGANELEFLKLVLERGQMLQNAVLVLAGVKDSATAAATIGKLKSLASTAKLPAEQSALEILARPRGHAWSYRRASDLSVSDPFPC